MSRTLDVSKLSGWLNDDAPCRVENKSENSSERGHAKRAGTARVRAERTWNMAYMVVTLDVSKFSGWLNADAPCRVERRAFEVRAGRWYRAQLKGTRNITLMVVTLDVSKPSGWLNADASCGVKNREQ
eukprot:scaffold9927_cov59-Phaeocystis_antarctica.AAC.2